MEKAEALAWHEESVVTVLRRENQHNKEFDMVCAVCGNCRNTVLQRFSELEIRTEIFVLCSVRWSHSPFPWLALQVSRGLLVLSTV